MRPSCSVTRPSKLLTSTGLPVTMLFTSPLFRSSNSCVWFILRKGLGVVSLLGSLCIVKVKAPDFEQAWLHTCKGRAVLSDIHGVQCNINFKYLYIFTPRFWITANPWQSMALCWESWAFFLALKSHLDKYHHGDTWPTLTSTWRQTSFHVRPDVSVFSSATAWWTRASSARLAGVRIPCSSSCQVVLTSLNFVHCKTHLIGQDHGVEANVRGRILLQPVIVCHKVRIVRDPKSESIVLRCVA